MASVEECRAALDRLAARLADVDPSVRRRHALNRRLSCRVSDLGVTFAGQLRDGCLYDIELGESGRESGGQVKLTVSSDDLVALTDGRLSFATAWARGRLRIDASMMDLLKLRALM